MKGICNKFKKDRVNNKKRAQRGAKHTIYPYVVQTHKERNTSLRGRRELKEVQNTLYTHAQILRCSYRRRANKTTLDWHVVFTHTIKVMDSKRVHTPEKATTVGMQSLIQKVNHSVESHFLSKIYHNYLKKINVWILILNVYLLLQLMLFNN